MTKPKNGADVVSQVKDLIYRSAVLMDGEKFEAWLNDLCAPNFRYLITTYGHEIRREQEWFESNRDELVEMMNLMPMHNTDHSPLSRHVTVYTVDVEDGGKIASAVSSVVVYKNMLDGINSHLDSGETRLFAVGKYLDKISLEGDRPRLVERNVRLDTRRLDKGSHYPL